MLAAPVQATAAAPSPDPPPLGVAPEAPPVARTPPATTQRTQPAPARVAPVVVVPTPIVQRPTPVLQARPKQPRATPKAAAPTPRMSATRAPRAVEQAVATPHDRPRVPLASFVTTQDALDRGLLFAAGIVLLLAALGGAVLLAAVRRQLLVAGLVLVVILAPDGGAATSPVSYSIVGTSGANGWYTSNVTIRWTVVNNGDLVSSTCPLADQITAEGTSSRQCTTTFTWGTVLSPPNPLVIRIDKTPPTGVGGSLVRGPDADGWYNHPVAASFSGQDAVSGIAACSAPTYTGGDSASAALGGTCSDAAGNVSAAASVGFKYDATPPTVTPTPERQPDSKGWYRKPVTVSFGGSDAMSGVASCSAPARYAGPDLDKAAVVGSCRDRAGNVAEASHVFQYDASAPRLARVQAKLDKGVARLAWDRAADVVQVEIVRSPGINGAKATIVYRGKGVAFVDRTVRAGVRYRYALSVADVAGNVATKTVTALEPAALYGPTAGTTVRAPPLLRWQRVSGARFYNVQLYRNGVKILSIWPRAPKLQLSRTWSYGGKRQRLRPGLYRWYVWPARGTRERPTYGRVLGSSTFRVVR